MVEAVPSAVMSDRCDSCGDQGPDLITVQRIYVQFGSDGQVTGERPADEFETWCAVCRTIYPHEVILGD